MKTFKIIFSEQNLGTNPKQREIEIIAKTEKSATKQFYKIAGNRDWFITDIKH
jgi:hypothetical protein